MDEPVPCLSIADGLLAEVLIDSSAVKAHRSAAGGKGGGAKSGHRALARRRTTKIHALTDGLCRPVAFLLTGGQVADCKAGMELPARLPECQILHGDKGYDSDAIRRFVEAKGAMPNIPPKANRIWKNCFSPRLYRDRNAVELMLCRIKDFRRIATRYDRSATNFPAAVCIAATVCFWLSVWSLVRSLQTNDQRTAERAALLWQYHGEAI